MIIILKMHLRPALLNVPLPGFFYLHTFSKMLPGRDSPKNGASLAQGSKFFHGKRCYGGKRWGGESGFQSWVWGLFPSFLCGRIRGGIIYLILFFRSIFEQPSLSQDFKKMMADLEAWKLGNETEIIEDPNSFRVRARNAKRVAEEALELAKAASAREKQRIDERHVLFKNLMLKVNSQECN